MPASIRIESATVGDTVHLGETFIPEDPASLGSGEDTRVVVRNVGDTTLREISVHVEGPGKDHVQLAVDINGEPGAWTDVGGSINAASHVVNPDDAVAFWARASYRPEDSEGRLKGEFVIQAISV